MSFNSFLMNENVDVKRISCSENAGGADLEVGKKYSMTCDELCGGSVWGCPRNNGWVTGDSSICSVAKMLAVPLGSPFTLVKVTGQTSYSSCTMNGITSNSYGSYPGSFRIDVLGGENFNLQDKIFPSLYDCHDGLEYLYTQLYILCCRLVKGREEILSSLQECACHFR